MRSESGDALSELRFGVIILDKLPKSHSLDALYVDV